MRKRGLQCKHGVVFLFTLSAKNKMKKMKIARRLKLCGIEIWIHMRWNWYALQGTRPTEHWNIQHGTHYVCPCVCYVFLDMITCNGIKLFADDIYEFGNTHRTHTHTLTSMQKSTTANTGMGNRKKTCDFLRFFSFYFVLFFMFQNFLLIGLECLLFVCLLSQLKSHKTSCRFANEQPFSSFSSSSSQSIVHTRAYVQEREEFAYTHTCYYVCFRYA